MKMSKREFDKWVEQINDKLYDDQSVFTHRMSDNIIGVYDSYLLKSAIEKYNPNDKSDYNTQVAIAYAKLRGIEVPKVEESKFERVKDGASYYSIGSNMNGQIVYYNRTEGNDAYDNSYCNNKNYFYNVERAKEVVDKIRFLLELERFHDIYCPNYKPDWSDSSIKYFVYFDCKHKKYSCNCSISNGWCEETQVYFPTFEIAQKVCDELNECL